MVQQKLTQHYKALHPSIVFFKAPGFLIPGLKAGVVTVIVVMAIIIMSGITALFFSRKKRMAK